MAQVPDEVKAAHTDNVTAVLVFLLFSQKENPRQMAGGRSIDEAVTAFCKLIGVPEHLAREKLLS